MDGEPSPNVYTVRIEGKQLPTGLEPSNVLIGNVGETEVLQVVESAIDHVTVKVKFLRTATGPLSVAILSPEGTLTSEGLLRSAKLISDVPDTAPGELKFDGFRIVGVPDVIKICQRVDGTHILYAKPIYQIYNITDVCIDASRTALTTVTTGVGYCQNSFTNVEKGTSLPGNGFISTDVYLNGVFYPACTMLKPNQERLTVKLLVNNTEAQDDDIVVKKPPAGSRNGTRNGAIDSHTYPGDNDNIAGPADNHIPLTVKLQGPPGGTGKVTFSISGGGNVIIQDDKGVAIPATGIDMTVGADVPMQIVGDRESSDLNDVKITARIGGTEAGEGYLTVIWTTLAFRGSSFQGQDLTKGSTALFSTFDAVTNISYTNQVGLFQYRTVGKTFDDTFFNQMEIRADVKPDKIIPNVIWDIKRDISRCRWENGVKTCTIQFQDDDPFTPANTRRQDDEDLIQNDTPLKLFVIDAVGFYNLRGTHPQTMSIVSNFREWVEVRIGKYWYIASEYKNWNSLLHIRTTSTNTWTRAGAGTNQILEGLLNGDVNTFDESYSLTSIAILTSTLPDGKQGKEYVQLLSSTGGLAPVTWAIADGTLPTGITLEQDGTIKGTPTADGTFNFTVKVTDASKPTSLTATKALSIRVTQ